MSRSVWQDYRSSDRGSVEHSPRQTKQALAPTWVEEKLHLIERSPVTSLIGNTPLVPLKRVVGELPSGVSLYVKIEGMNPGGSVKDRPALFIIREALRQGLLTPQKTLVDATSGNTGIAYAMLGAVLGIPVHLFMSAKASVERVQLLRAYGAQLTLTDPEKGTEGAREAALALVEAEPELCFFANQYDNPANPLAHYLTTGPEIWAQTEGKVTHFVAGVGTGGTMMGVGRYLRERNAAITLVGVQPDTPQHGIAGLKHIATSIVPRVYDPSFVDRVIEVRTEEAETMVGRITREEGLFVGISAGAAVIAALRVARELSEGVVVAVLPDGGFKYLSAPFWGH